jgi:hypothetical protein
MALKLGRLFNVSPELAQAIKLDWGLFPRETRARCGKKSRICDYAGLINIKGEVVRKVSFR